MKFKHLLYAIIIGLVVQGCNVINPAEPIPTYILVDSFKFAPQTLDDLKRTGAATHAIGSVWAYYNDSPVGVFDLPAKIPVIASGHGSMVFSPGITINGLQTFQNIYPFYQSDTFSFDAAPGKVIEHNPTTRYLTAGNVNFPFNESFEVGTGGFTALDSGGVNIARVVDQSGSSYGTITLNTPNDSTEIVNSKAIVIPTGSVAYCELDYKGTAPLYMGLIAISGSTLLGPYYIIGLKQINDWQKIYISLFNFTNLYPADYYYLVFKTTLPAGQASGTVSLDNIKVVTF